MANAKRKGNTVTRLSLFRTFTVPPTLDIQAIETFYESIDTPISLSLAILYRYGQFDQVVSKEIDPLTYNCPHRFKLDFAAISFLRKNVSLPTTFDRKKVALQSFYQAEEQCKATNNRFRHPLSDPFYKDQNVWLHHAITRKIECILGDFSAEEVFEGGSWGPGSTTKVTGSNTSATEKFRSENEITTSLYGLVGKSMDLAYPAWSQVRKPFTFRESSKLLTVPKNAKTERTIAIEPGLNTWFQKSIGSIIRNKLRRNGYDLNSSSRNQSLAKLGSQDGSIATVDFSSASDTISFEVVKSILPPRWFNLLSACRTSCCELDGETIHLAKFSSMGNGFTFELESLIFVAAALAVSEYLNLPCSSVSVFGDDITIDSRAVNAYTMFCDYLGFTVNKKKSFSSGYFRESCGSYYFNGVDVKPYFHKKAVHGAKSIFKLVNGISRLSHSHNNYYGRDRRFLPLHSRLINSLPNALRIYGNLSSGDCCIHANFDEAAPAVARFGYEGFLHPGFVESTVSVDTDSPALLLARLRYGSDRFYGNSVDLRRTTRTAFKKAILVQQWYNFGPWY